MKTLVPMSDMIEHALFGTPRCDLLEKVVLNIVNKAVPPYADAWQFYRELVAIFEVAGGIEQAVARLRKSLKGGDNSMSPFLGDDAVSERGSKRRWFMAMPTT